MEQYIVLSVAGSDSSSGAGIQADIKSVMACGGYCATAITAITAQNTKGVNDIEIVSERVFRSQLDAILNDLDVRSIKIGMLPTVGMVESLREVITQSEVKNIVLDPVMVSTSGAMLVEPAVAEAIKERLFPLATLITPNIPESEYLTGLKIGGIEKFGDVAKAFADMGCSALLLKSGHLTEGDISDYLYNFESGDSRVYSYERINTTNTHGTGCSLSSSIATFLAKGCSLEVAVAKAEEFIHRAISAANYTMGSGYGAINHAYNTVDDFINIR